MRIYAIRNYEQRYSVSGKNKRTGVSSPQTEQKSDAVAFKKNEAVKGAGIGTLLGLGALTLISGGAAAPIAYAVYAGVSALGGGLLGNAIEELDKDNDNNGKK